jgi:hypothetical protein
MDAASLVVSIVTIIALFSGPALAVWYGNRTQKQNQERTERLRLFSVLMATRVDPLNMDRMRALALIDLVFYKDESVRRSWRDWNEAAHNTALNDAHGMEIRKQKYHDLLTEMARALGFDRITANEIQRSYTPESFMAKAQLQAATAVEFHRVLRNSQNFGTERQDGSSPLPLGEPPSGPIAP